MYYSGYKKKEKSNYYISLLSIRLFCDCSSISLRCFKKLIKNGRVNKQVIISDVGWASSTPNKCKNDGKIYIAGIKNIPCLQEANTVANTFFLVDW